jgi:hypothetical protein
MIRKRLTLAALLTVAACLDPTAGRAQSGGWTAGISGGPNVVRADDSDYTALRPHLRAHLLRRLSDAVSIGIEGAAFGLFDEAPSVTDIAIDSIFLFRPQVVGTQTLLLAVQLNLGPDTYVRPAVGAGRHAFAVYTVGANDRVVDADISYEAGLAGGVSLGHEIELGRVRVGIEGVAVRSQGEDSSSPRWNYALSVGPRFTF